MNNIDDCTSCFRTLLLWSVLVFMPVAAEAKVIVIEPDDFSEGADLSAISPYVTLVGFNGASVKATAPRFEFPAPTGNLTFGSFPHVGEPGGTGSCFSGVESSTNGVCHVGFGIFFHQPIDWVSITAINSGYSPGLNVQWDAFDDAGTKIRFGFAHGDDPDNYGQPFSFNLNLPGMASLMVGGSTGIDAMEFDRLVFKVSEPGSTLMFAVGMLGLFIYRHRHRGPRQAGGTEHYKEVERDRKCATKKPVLTHDASN